MGLPHLLVDPRKTQWQRALKSRGVNVALAVDESDASVSRGEVSAENQQFQHCERPYLVTIDGCVIEVIEITEADTDNVRLVFCSGEKSARVKVENLLIDSGAQRPALIGIGRAKT